MFGGDST